MNWTFWSRPTAASECKDIEPLLPLYADGMASAGETRRLEAHLPGCDDCRRTLAWLRATHQALAGRPIALPPPDLHARIAGAIAASSAMPSFLPPTRAFRLRPAYAAAASLTALGLIFGYSLLSGPHPQALHPAKQPALSPSQVAVVPVHKPVRVAVAPRRAVIKSLPVRRPTVFATTHTDADTPVDALARKQPALKKAPIILLKSDAVIASIGKVPTRLAPHQSSRVALIGHEAPVHKLPVIVPENTVPKVKPAPLEANAKLPSPPTVPVEIAPATVVPQEPVRVQTASASADLLGSVRVHVAQMHDTAYTPLRVPRYAQQFVAVPFTYGPTK